MAAPTTFAEWIQMANALSAASGTAVQLATLRDLVRTMPLLGYPRSTTVTAFTQPEVSGSVDIELSDVGWIQPGVSLSIGSISDGTWIGGMFLVSSIDAESNAIVATRLDTGESIDSSAAGVEIPASSLVSISAYLPQYSAAGPAAPENVVAELDNTTLTVTWRALSGDQADCVAIEWGLGDGAGTTPSGGRFVFVGPDQVQTLIDISGYGHFWVRAYSILNGSWSDPSFGTPTWVERTSPSAPSGITVALDANLLTIHWDEVADTSATVVARYWEDETTDKFTSRTPATKSYVTIPLPRTGTWHYELAIEGTDGATGDFSTAGSVDYSGIDTPSNAEFAVEDGVISATWENATRTDTVTLEWYSADSEGSSERIQSGTVDAISANGETEIRMIVEPGWYFLRLWNNYNGMRSSFGEPSGGTWIEVPAADAPTNVQITALSKAELLITWDTVTGADYISVQWESTTTPANKYSAILDGSAVRAVIHVPITDDYTLKVGSKTGKSDYTWSGSVTFSVEPPTAPTGFAGSNTDGNVTLSWNSLASDASVYMLEIQVDKDATDSTENYETILFVIRQANSVIYAQGSGNSYSYRIRSLDAFGNSSAWANVTVSS